MKPLISVCLPNLNTRPFLEPRMQSILSQTSSDWELIICDSFSDDGSWEYFQQFKGDPRVQLHQVPRKGIYAGWNECVSRAKGRYIHMATSDDVEEPTFQATLLNLLERESQADCNFAYSDFRHMDSKGIVDPVRPEFCNMLYINDVPTVPVRRAWEGELLHAIGLWPPWISMNSVILRRELLEKTGPFPDSMGAMSDMLWACRACVQGGDAVYTPEILAYWRRHDAQASPAERPEEWDDKNSWLLIDVMQKFIRENSHRLPEHWRSVTRWNAQLQAYRWKDVQRWSGFSSLALKRNPKRFFFALYRLLYYQPDHIANYSLSVLTKRYYRDPVFPTWMTFEESMAGKQELFNIPPQEPLKLTDS